MIRGITTGDRLLLITGEPGENFALREGNNKPPRCVLITCGEAVLNPEADPLQLFIAEEADPHEASAGEDEPRCRRAAEAIDERREAEGAVAHLDVVEATLERGLDVEGLIEQQLYPLAGQS